jgi:hypothetical protein
MLPRMKEQERNQTSLVRTLKVKPCQHISLGFSRMGVSKGCGMNLGMAPFLCRISLNLHEQHIRCAECLAS